MAFTGSYCKQRRHLVLPGCAGASCTSRCAHKFFKTESARKVGVEIRFKAQACVHNDEGKVKSELARCGGLFWGKRAHEGVKEAGVEPRRCTLHVG